MKMQIMVGIGALALSYPVCVALGLDGCMSWMSNGHMPTEGELVGCLLVLGARVGQCVGAPVLALTYAAWLATARFRT